MRDNARALGGACAELEALALREWNARAGAKCEAVVAGEPCSRRASWTFAVTGIFAEVAEAALAGTRLPVVLPAGILRDTEHFRLCGQHARMWKRRGLTVEKVGWPDGEPLHAGAA